ncbi:MAG: acetyl-CoA carboxylase biotin carboxyl carrier protein [Acidobacteriota bacterium]
MDINEIRELIQLIEESPDIKEFEMERSGVRIRIRKQSGKKVSAATVQALPAQKEAGTQETAVEAPAQDESLHQFKSPIVGTFYTSEKPGADPFVKPGDPVSPGTVLCIVEAMKLFNQIECDVEGELVRRLVDTEQAVEYGEPLFEIRLKA